MNMMEVLEKMMIAVIGSTVRTATQQVANHTQHINETFPQITVLYSAGPLIEPPDHRTIPNIEPKWLCRVPAPPTAH